MSTARTVPETRDLDGDDAIATLRRASTRRLLADSFRRLRFADGFSHSRAMAFQLVLTLIPGTIVVVAAAARLRWTTLSESIVRMTHSLAPGPAGGVFESAFGQGTQAASGHTGIAPLVFGGIAFLVAGTTAFGQIERAANRIYGVEADRRALHKYRLAAGLMVTAGVLVVGSVAIIGLGENWANGVTTHSFDDIWVVARWPLAAALLTVAYALIMRVSPRRRQPSLSWLGAGALLGVLGAIIVSLLFHLYLHASKGLGETYGPLAGFIGVMLWANLSCVVLFYGIAFAAELEAVRAGDGTPRSAAKVIESDPTSDPTPLDEHAA
jgi:YihY family inner membrane protein